MRGASRLAVRLNIPLVVIGLTVVAFGTSLPELVVSLIANLQGGSKANLAIGNVVGSNIANLALILGVVTILRPLSVDRQLIQREYPLMIGDFIAVHCYGMGRARIAPLGGNPSLSGPDRIHLLELHWQPFAR